ncbi:MAG: SHOCT domain-containing protein [Desulfobacula sp.]|nr:SHOCT domain-containing protein [Desulfobacula sp.]
MYFKIGVNSFVFFILGTGISFAGWNQDQAFYPRGHMMGGGYMGWMMILFWAILLFILIFVIRWVLQLSQSKNNTQTPIEILKKRLSNGEIDIEEFKEKRQFL